MNKGIIISIISLGLIFISLFYFFLGAPLMGSVTEDRPIVKWLCEKQANCHSDNSKYKCSQEGHIIISADKELSKWGGYRGCNESTEGYLFENNRGYIIVESCGCGGIQ